MDMSLSKLWEIVDDRAFWHGIANSGTRLSDWTTLVYTLKEGMSYGHWDFLGKEEKEENSGRDKTKCSQIPISFSSWAWGKASYPLYPLPTEFWLENVDWKWHIPLADLAQKTTWQNLHALSLWANRVQDIPWWLRDLHRWWSHSAEGVWVSAWTSLIPPILKPQWTVRWARKNSESHWASGAVCNSIFHFLIHTGTKHLIPSCPPLWSQGRLITVGD